MCSLLQSDFLYSLFILDTRKVKNKSTQSYKETCSFYKDLGINSSHCINIFTLFWAFYVLITVLLSLLHFCLFSFVMCIGPVTDGYTSKPYFYFVYQKSFHISLEDLYIQMYECIWICFVWLWTILLFTFLTNHFSQSEQLPTQWLECGKLLTHSISILKLQNSTNTTCSNRWLLSTNRANICQYVSHR